MKYRLAHVISHFQEESIHLYTHPMKMAAGGVRDDEKIKINRLLHCLVWSLKYLLCLSAVGFSKEIKESK